MIEIKNDKEFIELVNKLEFRYAKTYTNFAPHEYVVAEEGTPEIEIIRALNKYIQYHEKREKEVLFKTEYQVVFIDNYKYWPMEKWNITSILNRNWDFKNKDGSINKSITESKKGS